MTIWETMEPTDAEFLTFGKRRGDNNAAVRLGGPRYCEWIMQTAEEPYSSSPQLFRFAQYLTLKCQQEAGMAGQRRKDRHYHYHKHSVWLLMLL